MTWENPDYNFLKEKKDLEALKKNASEEAKETQLGQPFEAMTGRATGKEEDVCSTWLVFLTLSALGVV